MSFGSIDKPFSPKKSPIFYGWPILGFSTLGLLSSAPGQTIGVSPFTDPLIDAIGLTRDQLSMAYMFGTVTSSLFLAQAGKLYDRFGARVVGTLACVMLGLVLLALGQCQRVIGALDSVLPLSTTTITFAVMLIGFFALRFSGQGVLTMTSRNMLLKWFERHRGLVVGISGVFVSLGFSLTPKIFGSMIDYKGLLGFTDA